MIDLHAHSTISDGTLTPTQIVRLAKKNGLTAIAITDHDSIDGHDEAVKEAKRIGMTFVKGIEFSVTYGEERLIHLLGLGIEPECEGFMTPYLNYRKERSTKLGPVFDQLMTMGVAITPEAVEPFIVGAYMDRQAIAKYLVDKGYAEIMKFAWINYLDLIPYAKGELIDPRTAIDAVHAAGGKVFMAHYHIPIGLKGYSEEEIHERLTELKAMGLDGLEYYYPSFTKEDQLKCGQYLDKYDFIASGGTDFHGTNRAHIQLGVGQGDFKVPERLLNDILEIEEEESA